MISNKKGIIKFFERIANDSKCQRDSLEETGTLKQVKKRMEILKREIDALPNTKLSAIQKEEVLIATMAETSVLEAYLFGRAPWWWQLWWMPLRSWNNFKWVVTRGKVAVRYIKLFSDQDKS